MYCVTCNSTLEKGKVNHTIDFKNQFVIVKDVPANVCDQCGEYTVDHNIAIKLERLVEKAKKYKNEVVKINFDDESVSVYVRLKKYRSRTLPGRNFKRIKQ